MIRNIVKIPARIALAMMLLCNVSCQSMLGDMGSEIISLQKQMMALLAGTPLPEISLVYGGNMIPAGDLIDMGSRLAYDAVPKEIEITITNTGDVPVILTDIILTGKYSDPFEIKNQDGTDLIPVTIPVKALGEENNIFVFKVLFKTPVDDTGFKAAVVSIITQDEEGDEYAPFNVTVACESTLDTQGILKVYRFNKEITNGGTYDMNTSTSCTFTIWNMGTADISGITISLAGNSDFSIPQTAPENIAPDEYAIIRICFTPSDVDTRESTLTIGYNDGTGTGTFTLRIIAAVDELPIPDIEIRDTTNSYPSSSTYTFHSRLPDTWSQEKVFNIHNLGTGNLVISNVEIEDTGNAFSFTGPYIATVKPGEYTTFTARYHPQDLDDHSAKITITCNDQDENTYVLNVTGSSLLPVIRVMENGSEVSSGTIPSLAYGNCIADEDNFILGGVKTFTVHNNGTAPLVISSITPGGAAPDHFDLDISGTDLSIAPGGSTTFTVQFDPLDPSPQIKNAAVIIASNDIDYPSYLINLTGTALEARMNVSVQVSAMRAGPTILENDDLIGEDIELNWDIAACNSDDCSSTEITLTADNEGFDADEEFTPDSETAVFTIPKYNNRGFQLTVTTYDNDGGDNDYLADAVELPITYDMVNHRIYFSLEDTVDPIEEITVSGWTTTPAPWEIPFDGSPHDYCFYTYSSTAGEIYVRFTITVSNYVY